MVEAMKSSFVYQNFHLGKLQLLIIITPPPLEQNRHAHHMYPNVFIMTTYFNISVSPHSWRYI